MKKRESMYNTCNPIKIQILKKIYVDNPKNIENYTIKKMDNYKIQDKKKFFKCSYNQIINVISSCVLFFENKMIDIEPEPDVKLSRINNETFNKDKIAKVKFIDENDLNDICINSDSKSESDGGFEIQKGGNYENYYGKYIKYHLKFLELKLIVCK
jgi:hypothetical protein